MKEFGVKMLSHLNKVKAIFFDFDGTLVDSLPVLKQVYMDFLEKLGQKGSEEEFQKLNGPNIDEIIQYLKAKYAFKDSTESIKEMFHHLFKSIYSHQVEFFPNAVEFLRMAKSRGYRLYVVTSAEPIMVSLVFKKYHLDEDILEGIISSRDLSNGKPHPEVYLHTLKHAGLNPDEVVAFEDSENGILASIRAGITTFAFGVDRPPHPDAIPVKDWHQVIKAFSQESYGRS